jgi:hypothetical protein
MTTTKHPTIEKAEAIIRRASELLEDKWHRSTEHDRGYGIGDALIEAASGDRVPLVVAERQLAHHELDVWWNDLVCSDAVEAAEETAAVADIDPAHLYGSMWEANVGLLVLAGTVSKDQLNQLGNVLTREASDAFIDACQLAVSLDRDRQLRYLCEDVHYATAHYATTPAGVRRRLRGIRALECVAAHHVLRDHLSVETARVLVDAVAQIILPTTARG